jgi:hypothetical protein
MLEPVVCWIAANRMTPDDFVDLTSCRFLYQLLDQATLPLFAFVSLLRYRRQQTLAEVVLPHE